MTGTTLQRGWWVVLTLERDCAPMRSYTGRVEDLDERGVRLALIDWRDGEATDIHLFVPWRSITSALVATDAADLSRFEERAGQWQRYCASLGGEYDRDRAHESRSHESMRPREGPRRRSG